MPPKDSLGAGISIVYQELNLIPHLTVAENIFANRLPRKNGFVQWKKLKIPIYVLEFISGYREKTLAVSSNNRYLRILFYD